MAILTIPCAPSGQSTWLQTTAPTGGSTSSPSGGRSGPAGGPSTLQDQDGAAIVTGRVLAPPCGSCAACGTAAPLGRHRARGPAQRARASTIRPSPPSVIGTCCSTSMAPTSTPCARSSRDAAAVHALVAGAGRAVRDHGPDCSFKIERTTAARRGRASSRSTTSARSTGRRSSRSPAPVVRERSGRGQPADRRRGLRGLRRGRAPGNLPRQPAARGAEARAPGVDAGARCGRWRIRAEAGARRAGLRGRHLPPRRDPGPGRAHGGRPGQRRRRLRARGARARGRALSRGPRAPRAAAEQLTELCRSAGLEWSVQSGVLQLLPRGRALQRSAVVLSSDTGLVGSPRRTGGTARRRSAC